MLNETEIFPPRFSDHYCQSWYSTRYGIPGTWYQQQHTSTKSGSTRYFEPPVKQPELQLLKRNIPAGLL